MQSDAATDEGADKKYWAFLSYSHQDSKTCVWLHQALESYRIPKRLRGQQGRDGLVPDRLFPIFRDRDELPGSAELGANLTNALRGSRYLIVLCSPAAARSRWVNEEIRQFKLMGGEQRILALILDGEPNATDKPESGLLECFPDTLRFRLNADGSLSDTRVEPIAADIRKGGEAKSIALLRLVAGLLGVPFDELRQRDKERNRRRLVWQGALVTALGTALVGAFALYVQRERLDRFESLGRESILANQSSQAAVYLAAAYRGGRRSPELAVMLDHAMRSVDTLTTETSLGKDKQIRWTEFDRDGGRLLALTSTDEAVYLRADSGAERFRATLATARGASAARLIGENAIAYARGSERLMISTSDGRPSSPLPLEGAELLDHGNQPVSGTQLLARTSTGSLVLVDIAAGKRVALRSEACASSVVVDARIVCGSAKTLSVEGEGQALKSVALPYPLLSLSTVGTAGREILTALADGSVQRRSATTLVSQIEVRHPGGVEFARSSEDGALIATAGTNGSVLLWQSNGGRLVAQMAAHVGKVRDLAFFDGDRRLATIGEDGLLKVWDAATGGLYFSSDTGQGIGVRMAVSAKGRRAVTFSDAHGASLKFWDLAFAGPSAIERVAAAAALPATLTSRFKGDYRRVATANGSVQLEPFQPGNPKILLSGGVDTADALVVAAPNGRWIATGGRSGVVMLWSASTQLPVARFVGHQRAISALRFTGDYELESESLDGVRARWSFDEERRRPEVVNRRVRCRVPFQLVSGNLTSVGSRVGAC